MSDVLLDAEPEPAPSTGHIAGIFEETLAEYGLADDNTAHLTADAFMGKNLVELTFLGEAKSPSETLLRTEILEKVVGKLGDVIDRDIVVYKSPETGKQAPATNRPLIGHVAFVGLGISSYELLDHLQGSSRLRILDVTDSNSTSSRLR